MNWWRILKVLRHFNRLIDHLAFEIEYFSDVTDTSLEFLRIG
jgi:hypothetical protein